MSQVDDSTEFKPLKGKVRCTDSRCEDEKHCFKQQRRRRTEPLYGACRDCGVHLIDWERVHQRNSGDGHYTFEALKNELIRHHFWHETIDQKALDHATRKGRRELHSAVGARLRKYVAPPRSKLPRDGRQTPFEGNVIFYGQHAVAACCRACIEYWHDIPPDRDLKDDEIEYLSNLVCQYIDERMPTLAEEGQYVPRRPTKPREDD